MLYIFSFFAKGTNVLRTETQERIVDIEVIEVIHPLIMCGQLCSIVSRYSVYFDMNIVYPIHGYLLEKRKRVCMQLQNFFTVSIKCTVLRRIQ